jgi:hypothetical protein
MAAANRAIHAVLSINGRDRKEGRSSMYISATKTGNATSRNEKRNQSAVSKPATAAVPLFRTFLIFAVPWLIVALSANPTQFDLCKPVLRSQPTLAGVGYQQVRSGNGILS